jgi:hypothetical protein
MHFEIINCNIDYYTPKTVKAQFMVSLPPGVGPLLSNGWKNAQKIASQSACGGEERNPISGLKVTTIKSGSIKAEI